MKSMQDMSADMKQMHARLDSIESSQRVTNNHEEEAFHSEGNNAQPFRHEHRTGHGHHSHRDPPLMVV